MLGRFRMTSVTLAVPEEVKNKLKEFTWVNWSEIAREETMKKIIFENYMKTGNITDEEWKFCEKIDWHPVDELPLRGDFKKEMERRRKEKSIRLRSIAELFKS